MKKCRQISCRHFFGLPQTGRAGVLLQTNFGNSLQENLAVRSVQGEGIGKSNTCSCKVPENGLKSYL